jgi:hypothetical protein
MIPCNELRIGNYVLVENNRQRISVISPQSIHSTLSSFATEEKYTVSDTAYSLESILPVPLTDEVLQQCNFVYHDYFKFWQLIAGTGENRSEMDIDGDYNIIDFMRRPVVKKVGSLHQLQNIYFMLKGKELNVSGIG